MELSDLNHIWISLELLLLNKALFLGDQHLLVADNLLVLSIEHLLELILLLNHSLLHDLKSLNLGSRLLKRGSLLQESPLWDGGGLFLKDHWGWAVRFI